MNLELLVGAIKMDTSDYGSPYEVIEDIRYAKKENLDVLIGPEWSLTCSPGIFPKSMLQKAKAKKVINSMFNAPNYLEYSPRDAKEILIEAVDSGIKKFDKIPYIPHSKREYDKILKDILKESKDSSMLILPGTGMFYDDKSRILYNNMPVIEDGRIIKNIYKFNDGLGSKFNLEKKLRLYPSETTKNPQYSMAFGDSPIINSHHLDIGVEICADSGLLKEMKVKDLNLQVLSSCGNSSTVPVINNNGYLVIDDGFIDPEIKVINNTNLKLKYAEKGKNMDIFNLRYDI